MQEITRFTKADTALMYSRPLRYCAMFESYPASLPYVARFHAKKVLKFRDALLTSYHRNEVIGLLHVDTTDCHHDIVAQFKLGFSEFAPCS